MATTPIITFIPIFFIVIVVVVVALVILNSSRRVKIRKSAYQTAPIHQRYVPGQFSQQMELDMRLPYRRFKKLYPETNITYDEYKKMQMQSAYRRSLSSQENKRMVR